MMDVETAASEAFGLPGDASGFPYQTRINREPLSRAGVGRRFWVYPYPLDDELQLEVLDHRAGALAVEDALRDLHASRGGLCDRNAPVFHVDSEGSTRCLVTAEGPADYVAEAATILTGRGYERIEYRDDGLRFEDDED